MRNIDVKDDEESLVAAVIGFCEVVRRVETFDERRAVILREEAVKSLEQSRQRIWDCLPDKLKREARSEEAPPEERPAKKRKDKPSQAIEPSTDFIP